MDRHQYDRRRYPRVRPSEDVRILCLESYNVDLHDISQTGVLLASEGHLRVGLRGQLRVLLDREPVSATVELVRQELATQIGKGRTRRAYGGRFTLLDEKSLRAIQRFLREDRPVD